MAYTTFQKTFWSDNYVLRLSRDEKLVYCYLITNDKTQQCGIYELAMDKVCLELSVSPEELLMILKKFSDDKKICYSMETQEVCLINWIKHNGNTSWKTMESVKKQLMNIKNPQLLLILYDPRQPLFSGTKKEKIGPNQYQEIPHIIENPWKDYFANLSDADLLEIRTPYLPNQAPWKPLLSPLHAPSTITEQKQYNTETRTETGSGEPHPPSSFESFKPAIKKPAIDQIIEYWNSKDGLPKTRLLTVNLGERARPLNDVFQRYSIDEVKKSVDNYHTIQSNPEKYDTFTSYGDVFGFIKSGVEKFYNDSDPLKKYLLKSKSPSPSDFTSDRPFHKINHTYCDVCHSETYDGFCPECEKNNPEAKNYKRVSFGDKT